LAPAPPSCGNPELVAIALVAAVGVVGESGIDS